MGLPLVRVLEDKLPYLDISVVEQRSRVAILLVLEYDVARREKIGVDEFLELGRHLCERLGVSGDASLRGLR